MCSVLQPCETVFSLGSNQGDRLVWLARAVEALRNEASLCVTACSPVYETDPVGVSAPFRDQCYLNQIVLAETTLTPAALLETVHAIENNLGRVRGPVRNLPRTLDIDIIALGTRRIASETLTLPHPRAHERRFVLQPLADLRPDLRLPGFGRSVAELLDALPETPGAVRFEAWHVPLCAQTPFRKKDGG